MVLVQWKMASTSTRCKGSIRIPMPRDAKPGRPTKLDYCYGIATVFELDMSNDELWDVCRFFLQGGEIPMHSD